MTTPIDDHALEALLKDETHLDDAGFSDRVLARMPRRRRVQRRDLVIAGSALAAAAIGVAVWLGSGGLEIETVRSSWVHAAAVAMAVGLVAWGALGAAQSEG